MSRRRDRAEAATRTWVAAVVRSGLYDARQREELVAGVIRTDHPRLAADDVARAWIAEAEQDWAEDASGWPEPSEHDLLEQAFADLEEAGIPVLQGIADHWAAQSHLDVQPARAIAWFTAADVWHAVDEPMLEVNVWHGTSANIAAGDALLDEVLAAFERAGLEAHFDEGRIEVSAHWQRRPAAAGN